ncbi:hypothetical protein ACLOJK_003331 [Asimina triloba]
MRGEGFRPNRFVLASLVSGRNRSSENVCVGIQIHGLVAKVALLRDVYVSSAILHLYGVCGFLLDVQRLFDEMPERNVISWTSLMVGYSKNGNPKEAVFGLVVVSGFETNVSVANALISMFDSFGRVEDALISLFSRNAFYRCATRFNHNFELASGQLGNALELLPELLRNAQGNHVTSASLLAAFSGSEALIGGKMVHALIILLGFQENLLIGNALVSMYGNCCEMVEAEHVFQKMAEMDVVTWNAMTGGHLKNLGVDAIFVYTIHGHMASLLSRNRPNPPMLAFTNKSSTRKALNLHWGVTPLEAELSDDIEENVEKTITLIKERGMMNAPDVVLVVSDITTSSNETPSVFQSILVRTVA